MTRRVTVAAVSPEVRIGELDANLQAVTELVAAAADRGAQLVVAPELATSGYVFESRSEARATGLTRDDERWTPLQRALGANTVAVVGYCEIDGDQLYNTAAVITRGQRIGDYRKSHLWGNEKNIFAAGEEAGARFDTPVGALGVAICYDNEFPEVPRRLALAGAEILALPVNWPLVPRPAGEHAPEIIQAMAAARSSRLATVVADRAGIERDVPWTGGTAVIDEDGWISAEPIHGIALTALTLRGVDDKTLPPYNDLFADRRPHLY